MVINLKFINQFNGIDVIFLYTENMRIMEISNVSYANILIYWMEKKIIYVLLKAVSPLKKFS